MFYLQDVMLVICILSVGRTILEKHKYPARCSITNMNIENSWMLKISNLPNRLCVREIISRNGGLNG